MALRWVLGSVALKQHLVNCVLVSDYIVLALLPLLILLTIKSIVSLILIYLLLLPAIQGETAANMHPVDPYHETMSG